MEMIFDILRIYGRIITIIPLLLIVTLIMGKRSIGELPVFDFLVIIILGAVVGADIADPDINHIFTFLSVTAIAGLQILVSKLKIKHRRFGRLITFEPTIVIRNGTFIVNNLRKIRYSLDNVLQMLREKEVFDVSEVELALIEPNGNISIFKKPHKSNATVEDLGIKKMTSGVPYPVIIEGKIHNSVLSQLNLNVDWLLQQLQKKGLKAEDIFFASVNEKHELHFSLQDYKNSSLPELSH